MGYIAGMRDWPDPRFDRPYTVVEIVVMAVLAVGSGASMIMMALTMLRWVLGWFGLA